MAETKSIDFVYFDAGGGHRSAATALKAVIDASSYGWSISLVNLQEVLDPLDIFRKLTRIRLQDIYNLLLAKGWTIGSLYLLPLMQAVIRLYHGPSVKLLAGYWSSRRPVMVVSLVPNLNRALYQSLQQALPGVPYVTILTDLADYPPHFWMERQPQYFICGTPRAREQALQMGHPDSRVFQVSGMILRPQFYQALPLNRGAERERLGLHPTRPTGVVLFGGEGSNVMFPIARQLGNAAIDLQLITICGRNAKLRRRLSSLKTRNNILVEGFTKEIPHLMSLADFFIGKPGPGSISEALRMNLPVIVESNAWTLPQERYNARWVHERGVGIVLKNFRNIENVVAGLLSSSRLSNMKQNVSSIDNQAVFEIPAILEKILRNASSLH